MSDPTDIGDKTTKTTTPSAGLMVVKGDEYVQHTTHDDDAGPRKRGHICCGCCCDTRKAVIVVNIINICFAVIGIVSLSVIASDKFAAQVRL